MTNIRLSDTILSAVEVKADPFEADWFANGNTYHLSAGGDLGEIPSVYIEATTDDGTGFLMTQVLIGVDNSGNVADFEVLPIDLNDRDTIADLMKSETFQKEAARIAKKWWTITQS